MRTAQNVFFMILVFVVMFLLMFLWKPWGSTIVFGILGVYFLRGTFLFRKAKMIYIAILWAAMAMMFFVMTAAEIMRWRTWTWSSFLFLIIALLSIIMPYYEEEKNPAKVKKWRSVINNVPFRKLISLKYISELGEEEKLNKK